MADYIYRAEPIGEGEYSHTLVGELVRCGECIHNYANQIPSEDACSKYVELPITADFFCKYGERRADDV